MFFIYEKRDNTLSFIYEKRDILSDSISLYKGVIATIKVHLSEK